MALKYFVLLACVGSVAFAQRQSARSNNLFDFELTLDSLEPKETTTPVPILRYIDTQNSDGSYTYGYESGDGTYKIETRYATGEVKGKYGYYDDAGYYREVEYGADPKKGFMPSGEGLLAPEQPAAAPAPVTPAPFVAPAPTAAPRRAPVAQPREDNRRVVLRRRPRPQQQAEEPEQTESRFRNFDRISLPDQRRRFAAGERRAPSSSHPRITVARKEKQAPPLRRPAPPTQAPRRRPVARPQPAPAAVPELPRFAGPIPQPAAAALTPDFGGHPAKNINLLTGSYTVSYGR